MSRLVQLVELRTALRQATDTESELSRFPDAEMNGYINRGIAQLHVKVLAERGQGFQELTTTISTVKGQELYTLPAAFLEVVKVFMVLDGSERVLHTYEEFETDGIRDQASYFWVPPQYRIVSDSISLRRTPDAVYTISIKYVPSAVVLVGDSSTFDGIDGFEEYVIGYAAGLVGMKQGDDARIGMAENMQAKAVQNIQAIQHARNAAEAPHMVDVRGDKWWLGGRRGLGRWRGGRTL